MPEQVPCPICGSDKADPARKAADIVTCNKCSVTYLRTRPLVAELEKMYQAYASQPGSHMALPRTIEQVRTSGLRRDNFLSQVVEHAGPPGRVLDIGSGWGAFLMNARSRGYEVDGVEICGEMADFATNIFGVVTRKKQMEECDFKDGSFKVVTMIHSLEHMPSQRRTLSHIHRIMKDDGYLCGIVPNFGSYCSEKMRDQWPWLDPHMHYAHFTPKTLNQVLWMHGFNVHRMYTTTGDFDRNILAAVIRQEKPKLSNEQLIDFTNQLDDEDRGEEIRFMAQRI